MKVKFVSSILVAASAIGVVGTAIFAARGYKSASEVMKDYDLPEDLTTTEKVVETAKVTWKNYIPAAITGVATISCIIASHAMHLRTQAAMAGALATIGSQYKNLDRMAREKLGKEKYNEIKDGILSVTKPTKVAKKGPYDGKTLYYEPYTGQSFHATETDILRAECELNRRFNSRKGFVTMEEYLGMFNTDELKITPTELEYGWYMDGTFDLNASQHNDENGYYICLDTQTGEIKGDDEKMHQVVVINPSIPPADPSDEWVNCYHDWSISEMRELNH